ncbi:histidine phosphatase family protein [Methylobacter psychrophilus]|uniref:histidine phosphatase family protein n=1 Tax=Methylobacter psychrophilus TaxID=96941 RepID=UPI0021D4C365|nr:histidine phosphatase family protein [Methylobacter psychrophilus]
MKKSVLRLVWAGIAVSVMAFSGMVQAAPDNNLKIVIIRHGEKPENGDNLSCQGESRALQLPAVLYQKFNVPDYTYVPSLGLDKSTKHARMFQTVTPFAIKYNLTINSKYDEKDYSTIAKKILEKTGTVLMVWEHSAIAPLAEKLGVNNPPTWDGKDFDSIWVITYQNGKALLSTDKEGITTSPDCKF